jgi:VanZ family protein
MSMKTFDDAADVEKGDKYVHFIFYFIFTLLWFFFFKKNKGNTVKTRFTVFILGFVFGLFIEACQGLFTKDRSADVHDVLANTSGSLGAILILWLSGKISKKE